MPPWSSKLRNLYRFLRYRRAWSEAARRRYYRKIADEKKRLELQGVDAELIRRLCRHLANPADRAAEKRYLEYLERAV